MTTRHVRRNKSEAMGPTEGQKKALDLLLKKYPSLYEAALSAKPRIGYSTMLAVVHKPKKRSLSFATVQGFESLGVPREWLPLL